MCVAERPTGVNGVRVAIAHDYLTQRGGAEKVVLSMSAAFPEAPIYTTLYDPQNTYPDFADRDVRVSRLNDYSIFRKHHRAALPLLPTTASSIYVDADVLIASTSGWAHGFRTNGRKVAFCHSPARWLYLSDSYLGTGRSSKRAALALTSRYLRRWDRRAATSCDKYVAISRLIQRRISDVYGINADIVHPPVAMSPSMAVDPIADVQSVAPVAGTGSFYLCISRLLPYKNVDAVVRAFAGRDELLVIVGRGPEEERIRALKTDNVIMLSDLTEAQLAWLYKNCAALIAASYEDYGLTPIEAGVWGKPTLALRWGGFLDTVVEGKTGVFFDAPESRQIVDAVETLEALSFDPAVIKQHVEQFSERAFAEALYAIVDEQVRAAKTS